MLSFGAANHLGWLFPKEFKEVPEMVVVLVATAVSETVPQCPSLTPYADYMCPQWVGRWPVKKCVIKCR